MWNFASSCSEKPALWGHMVTGLGELQIDQVNPLASFSHSWRKRPLSWEPGIKSLPSALRIMGLSAREPDEPPAPTQRALSMMAVRLIV